MEKLNTIKLLAGVINNTIWHKPCKRIKEIINRALLIR